MCKNLFISLVMCCLSLSTNLLAQSTVIELPKQFHSYKLNEKLSYTPDNLFEYINGGAELYLSYGFIGMSGYKYADNDFSEVSVEIYEMTEAKNTFGVFTQSRDKEEYDYGQGSQKFTDAILFWKDRYFVIINTAKSTTQSQEAIHYLASVIDKSIPEKGNLPKIVETLPGKNLVSAGFIYFHHYIWLNAYYFIADHNILNINEETDAVLARYETGLTSRSYLLLVEYPDSETAGLAYEQLKQKYAPEISSQSIVQFEDGSWFTMWIKNNKIGAIFNGDSQESTKQLYENTISKM